MLTIWGRTSSVNVQKVMWAVGELGLAHERIDAGGAFGGLDAPDYVAMNPNRKIPVLRDGATVIWESNNCVRYLAAAYGAGTLWPADPATRARAEMWMDWQLTTLLQPMTVIFWGLIRTPEPDRDLRAIDAAAEAVKPLWRMLDAHLAGSAYVGGEGLTIGDIPVGCMVWRYLNLPVDRPSLPNVERWSATLRERPAYRVHVMLPLT